MPPLCGCSQSELCMSVCVLSKVCEKHLGENAVIRPQYFHLDCLFYFCLAFSVRDCAQACVCVCVRVCPRLLIRPAHKIK